MDSRRRKLKEMLKKLDTSSTASLTASSTFANPLGTLCKDIVKDITEIAATDEEGPILKLCEARWTVCERFLTSKAERSNLYVSQKRKKLRDTVQEKLRGITIAAEKAQGKFEQSQGSVLVERGTVVGIYGTPDSWVGYILCKARVIMFSSHHFQNDLPLPLRCDDKVSFLVPQNNRRTVLPGSIRVIEYCNELSSEAVRLTELFLKTSCEELLRNKQASALFAKLLSEEDALRIEKFIQRVLMMALDFIVLRFPIGSEEERETTDIFAQHGLNKSAYVDPREQRRFLSFLKGSPYPDHLVQFCEKKANAHDGAKDILVKTMFLLIALVKEFPNEAECSHLVAHIQHVIMKVLVPCLDDHRLGLKLMSLILSVTSSPPAIESWRSIPAVLTVEEFYRRVRKGMPSVPEAKATYRNVEEYFDTYYKLLREDTYRGLCRSVRRFLELDEDTLNQKSDAIYRIRFVEVVPYRMGQFNLCRVEWKPLTEAVKQEGGENSLYLHEGNLFCVSASGKFIPEKLGDALFAVKVSEHSTEGSHRKGILLKFLSADCNGISEVEAIEKLARHANKAVMVESPVFYRAYEPVLTALKAMDTQQFPFKSEVLNLKECPLDDGYLPKHEVTVDISPFQSGDMTSGNCKHRRVSDVHKELSANSILYETQVQAVDLALSQRLAIIQGPPGTGKTFLTTRIIQSLLNVQKQQSPIVVLAYKNRVLDQLVSKCTRFCGGKLIRLGRLSEDYHQDKTLQACLMSQKLQSKGAEAYSMRHLRRSVTGMWKDWKETLTVLPQKVTLSACLKLYPEKVIRIFFEFSGMNCNGAKWMQELHSNGPLRDEAEKIFEARKKTWLHSQQQDSDQTSTTKEYSGNVEVEDEHKERDRMCDTKDIFINASDDEESEEIAMEESTVDYLEVNDEMRKLVQEGTNGDPDQYLNSFFSCFADKPHEQAITRLKDTLCRMEEETQEAEGEYLEAKLRLLKNAKVVAMTTTKASIEHKLLHRLQPEMVVIEEAGGVLEPSVIACLTPNTKHLIMVGDYKQIGPTVVCQELRNKKLKDKHLKNFSASLMERLVDPNSVETGGAMPNFPFVCLDTQSRMNPALLPLFEQDYAQADGHNESAPLRTRPQILPLVGHPECMQFPLLWWSYLKQANGGDEHYWNGKIFNKLEVEMAATYCYWLYSEGFNPKDIAILTPYRAQVCRIKDELSSDTYGLEKFAQSSVFTVDEFQGHERDIVILSLVRNNNKSNVGFLMDKTRQVVAVSRQKRALCIIGCHNHFKANSPSWKERIKVFGTHVSEHLLIRGEKVKGPRDLRQLVSERLKQPGRCSQPRYAKLPMLAEDKCQTEMKDHGSNPADAQMPFAIEGEPSTGKHTTGNVQVLLSQEKHLEMAMELEEGPVFSQAGTCTEPHPQVDQLPKMCPQADPVQVFLRSKPSEADLRRHVCSAAGQKWQSICTYLGIPNAKVESVLGSNPQNVEEAFFQALYYWCAGNTSKEVTWSILLEAMKEAGLVYHVEDLLKKKPAEVATEIECTPAALPSGIVDMTAASLPVSLATSGPVSGPVTPTSSIVPVNARDLLAALDHRLDTKWRYFGTCLGVEYRILESIERVRGGNPEDCMLELVGRWTSDLEGTGTFPHTWQAVVEAVQLSGDRSLAQELASKCTPGGLPAPETALSFAVPTSSVGLIIGKKGRQLRRIEEETHLQRNSIQVSLKKIQGMQMVKITGQQLPDCCEAAKCKIEELVQLSRIQKSKSDQRREMGQSSVAERIDKYLSFLTFLKGTDQCAFKRYEGILPINYIWKNEDLYFLEACKWETSVRTVDLEDMHSRLRNYSWLQDSLHTAMVECLSGAPVYLKLEARFGKVLWRSDSQRTVSDEVLSGRHKVEDLEKNGKVSVDAVLGGKGVRWIFQTVLSDATILESVTNVDIPVIGDALRLDITCKGSAQEYLIRMKQNKEMPQNGFELVEVLVKPDKPYVFDCLNLERDLDLRVAVSYLSQKEDTAAAAEMKMIAQELCHGMALREGCLSVKEPPGCTIEYARKAKQTMYLVSHHDKVHGECPYILAHYEVEDCPRPKVQKPRSADRGMEVKLQLKNQHHEVELWNCQWMADFAVLVGKTPEEVFALKCCDTSKIKVRPKDKSEVTADSVIRELDPFVGCAMQLALIDRGDRH